MRRYFLVGIIAALFCAEPIFGGGLEQRTLSEPQVVVVSADKDDSRATIIAAMASVVAALGAAYITTRGRRS